ncbi:hypothetical protein KP78_23170 [Jeotgalibacillus soli]|uniref:Nucleoside transporter/FeoB GTPase Gate domain-containing protein n=2 Tax=Jeotgalibacillus soli TaxID=889306 RepID=A0A0C2VL93_9BACL|nr:hypothetical protein KP78_23170 [Jeotgalibacillus soli]
MPHLFSACVFICLLGLLLFPKESLDASTRGLELWWTIIFPSLLPFFILSDLLSEATWTSRLGQFLEPVMKPIFRVSGNGAIILLLGYTSGFPVGAKMSVKLYQEGMLSKTDAQKLICFTNGASPIFILGAIAAGLLQTPELGILLLTSHYLGNIIIGIFIGRMIQEDTSQPAFRTVIKEMKSRKSIGTLLQTAVTNSVQQLLLIGGLIVFFSVLSDLIMKLPFFSIFTNGLHSISSELAISSDWSSGFIKGLLEMSNGIALIAVANNDLIVRCLLIVAILSFGGFCIHAQIISCLHGSPLSYRPYLYSRIAHTILSPILLWGILQIIDLLKLPYSFLTRETMLQPDSFQRMVVWLELLHFYGPILTLITLFLTCLILIKKRILSV